MTTDKHNRRLDDKLAPLSAAVHRAQIMVIESTFSRLRDGTISLENAEKRILTMFNDSRINPEDVK